jgi:hypothetical protein
MKIKFLSLLFLVFIGPVALAQKANKATQTTTIAQDYKDFQGNYTSEENPGGFLIYVQGGKLMGKIPEQPSFELVHSTKNSYKTNTGLELHFIPEAKQLIVQKDGKRQLLVKTKQYTLGGQH